MDSSVPPMNAVLLKERRGEVLSSIALSRYYHQCRRSSRTPPFRQQLTQTNPDIAIDM